MEHIQVPIFYQPYLDRVKGGSVVQNLVNSGDLWVERLKQIPESSGDYRYEADKWSIKELVQHVTDSERIFAYRALRFARNDHTQIEGFDQNAYAEAARVQDRTLLSLVQEFLNVRSSSSDLYSYLNDNELRRVGVSNGYPMTVEAIGYILSGHVLHHLAILNERYS